MQRVNLIPATHFEARRRRAFVRRCAVACGIYGACVALVAAECRMALGTGREIAERRLADADAIVRHTAASVSRVHAELKSANATLAIHREIASQPDWSLLLRTLAREAGDSVVLKSCALNTRAAPPADSVGANAPEVSVAKGNQTRGPAATPRIVLLNLTGDGESQPAVRQFIVRLEKTGLFARVAASEMRHAALLGTDSVAFRLECTFTEARP